MSSRCGGVRPPVGGSGGAGHHISCGIGVCAERSQACMFGGWDYGGLGVRSVRNLFFRRWGSAVGDICRRCLPPDSVGLLLSWAWKVDVALLRAACGSGVGRPSTSWSPAAAAVCEGNGARLLHPRRFGRRGPAGGEQTAGLGSVVDRMGVPFWWVVCAVSASNWCVPPASGGPGPSGTVGAGAPWLCLGWVGLG